MNVCDRCRKEGAKPVTYQGKKYDLCPGCSDKILKFLKTKESGGFLKNILGSSY